jgi:hypothetical protein
MKKNLIPHILIIKNNLKINVFILKIKVQWRLFELLTMIEKVDKESSKFILI